MELNVFIIGGVTMRDFTELGESTRSKIIDSIKSYNQQHGYSPSVREIAAMTGIKSTSTIHRHLGILKERGKIEWNSKMPRTIVIKDSGFLGI